MKIETKFDIGQEVYLVSKDDTWYIDKGTIISISIEKNISKSTISIRFYVYYEDGITIWHRLEDYNNIVFATKEEAETKLKGIQNDNT